MISMLIVDDEMEILDELFALISSARNDIRVLKTSISREAKEILETDVIDVLLTDIKMPGINGFELSEIARLNNTCKIVYLTGYNDFQYAYNAIKLGCNDFILKNAGRREILVSINKLLIDIEKGKIERELLLEAERIKQLSQPQHKTEQNIIEYIKSYIWDSIGETITLNGLSEMVYFSPAYLSRTFKSTAGVTITEYLTHARIEKAKQLLLESNMKVQDIAERVGINAPAYFGRLFKRETGVTPQEFRQSHL